MHNPKENSAAAEAPPQEARVVMAEVLHGEQAIQQRAVQELRRAAAEGRFHACDCSRCGREFHFVQPRGAALGGAHELRVKCPHCGAYTMTNGEQRRRDLNRKDRRAREHHLRKLKAQEQKRRREAAARMLKKGHPDRGHGMVLVEGTALRLLDGDRAER